MTVLLAIAVVWTGVAIAVWAILYARAADADAVDGGGRRV